jgi:hypothetical protein
MPDANANPERRFFVEMITRDISLDDAILDMIDNSIDSLLRNKKIDLYKDFTNLGDAQKGESLAVINISISPRQFKIEDNCGGITFESARDDIFRFGHPDQHRRLSLSVFGIGMKRAIFKIGSQVEMESHALDSGFSMTLNVDDWLEMPEPDWKIPIKKEDGEPNPSKASTKIIITNLNKEVAELTKNPIFENRLIVKIRKAYPFYLGKYVSIFVNKKEVIGEDLSFAESDQIKPAIEYWVDGNVEAILICGFLPREKEKWKFENSGWYIVCNGRVVVYADKSELTGWGWKNILPQFMPKNRGFLGIIFFKSNHPEELPWNTTKRGIHSESAVYIHTRNRMVAATRSVIKHQDMMYKKTNDDNEPKEEYKDYVGKMQSSSATKQAAERVTAGESIKPRGFFFAPLKERPKLTTIQFKEKIEDVMRIKKRLGRIGMPNYEVGKKIFKYFLDRECSE